MQWEGSGRNPGMGGKNALKMHLIGEKVVKEEPELWMHHVWKTDVTHDGGRTFRKGMW